MDPLSDVLSLLKPQSYLTAGLSAGGDWAIRFTSHPGVIKCYSVTAGSCALAVDGVDATMVLMAGDCVIFPSGHGFMMGADLALTGVDAGAVLGSAQPGEVVVHNGGGDVMLMGTRFEVDGRKASALLGELPPVVHLRATDTQATLHWCIQQMMIEMRERGPGGSLAAHHLAHLMLLQAFRLYLKSPQARHRVGLLYALTDPHLGRVIEALHRDPARRWTLGDMALEAGMSRSVFAQRFRERVGETPLGYLTRWRMLLATDKLLSTRDTLATIAQSLGYGSENAFNTAFKRVIGRSPRRFTRDLADDRAFG